MKNPSKSWPEISYFHEGTRWAKEVKSELDVLERKSWKILCQAKSDGSYWRLDDVDKYQTRFLVKLTNILQWAEFDSTELEKQLLVKNRGGYSEEECKWKDCEQKAVNKSAFCEHHTYEMGTRE